MNESPIFVKVHDIQLWLLQATRKFPREQRFLLGQRLHDQAFTLCDHLVAATIDRAQKNPHLIQADIALVSLRKTIYLCLEIELFSPGQFRHVSVMTTDIGNLLGAWKKKSTV